MTSLLHPNAAHVAEILISRGHHGIIVTQAEATHTAADAAAAVGVDVGAITKSLVFLLDDDPVLLLVSGAHQVDLDKTGRRMEGKLTRAPLETAKAATGQPIGGVAPLGHPTNLPTYVDTALAQYPQLWAAAGHPTTVFRTTYSELLRITAGLAIDVD
ncbi:prolyl-tRNA editing enzyme YbaK/EbsC (Cys-tRNA(Pro) deacylase) [Rhodococcus sp. 27YEA15]|uniref:YbaK/EbsC family protein n=1 Tax=Rhodococcus sp. 27YEA15 TaxID=3156259 RepID=UPI003C7C498B